MSSSDINERVKALINCLASTQDDEADCVEFDREMDCLAEWIASGTASPSVVTPRIEAHLHHSHDCDEEFKALISVLRAESNGEMEEEDR
jgi:hypothetical protein